MPLYDLVVMLKARAQQREIVDVLKTVAQRVYSEKGVVTDVKSFGNMALAYEIKKRDGRHKEGQMLQMTVMAAPSFPKDMLYLNKDERLLRWTVVHNCGTRWLRGENTREAQQQPLAASSRRGTPFGESHI